MLVRVVRAAALRVDLAAEVAVEAQPGLYVPERDGAAARGAADAEAAAATTVAQARASSPMRPVVFFIWIS
ncbi:hypothetical protein GCM10020254_78820 [Streptomyces goshikiensis]